MAAGDDAQAAGERIEALLSALRSQAGPQVAATAEELVSCLVELYGAGLAAITEILADEAWLISVEEQLCDECGNIYAEQSE